MGAPSSEDHFRSNLQVSRVAYAPVPHSETRAGDIRGNGAASELPYIAEDVPVKDIERFGAYLKSHSLCDVGVLDEAEVFVVITEASEIRDAGTAAEIKVETVRGLEGRHVEQRFAGIEMARGLRPRIGARKHPRNTASMELRRYVAGAGAEEEGWAGGDSENTVQLPSTNDSFRESAFVQESLALSNGKFVGQRPGENLRHVVLRKRLIALSFERRNHSSQPAPCSRVRLRILGGGDQLRERVRSQHPHALRESPLCLQLKRVIRRAIGVFVRALECAAKLRVWQKGLGNSRCATGHLLLPSGVRNRNTVQNRLPGLELII